MSMYQKTLAQEVLIEGVGIHNGRIGKLRLIPASEDHGIRFIHERSKESVIVGKVVPEVAPHATVIRGTSWVLSTIEHLMAALAMVGIDNLDIVFDASEVPIFDGSALPFVLLLREAGITVQKKTKKYIVPRERILIHEGESRTIQLDPIDCDAPVTIVYERDPLLLQYGGSGFNITLTEESFEREIAPARTFGQLKQLDYLHSKNLALGTTLANTLVIGEQGFLNKPRFEDECVRHKVLDLIGDIALLGAPLRAAITASNTGHSFNRLLIQHLHNHPESWIIVS